MFCRFLLGVQKQTNTVGILLELGMTPVSLDGIKASIKNWERIRNNKCNTTLYQSFLNAGQDNLGWISQIRGLFESNGLSNLFKNKNEQNCHGYLHQRLKDQFHQRAFTSIRERSRLRVYSLLKKQIGLEEYLVTIPNVKHIKKSIHLYYICILFCNNI